MRRGLLILGIGLGGFLLWAALAVCGRAAPPHRLVWRRCDAGRFFRDRNRLRAGSGAGGRGGGLRRPGWRRPGLRAAGGGMSAPRPSWAGRLVKLGLEVWRDIKIHEGDA